MNGYKNKGFTLAEVLVCIVIIGVIMALSVQTIRIVKASYTSLSYYVFETIKSMVTSVYSGSTPEADEGYSGILTTSSSGDVSSLRTAIMKCKLSNGQIVSVLKGLETDSEDTPFCNNITGTQSTIFCESIAAISNTSGAVNCSNLYSKKASSAGPLIEADYGTSTPNFVTSNGQKYYVSNWYYDSSVSSNYGYRLIAVDLNGNKDPNINEQSGSKYPDVITFMIMDNGEIYPVGAAADNVLTGSKYIHYLTSRVKGYYYDYNTSRTDNIPSECNFKLKKSDGTVLVDQKTCNYAVVPLKSNSTNTVANTTLNVFSYREAYCTALGNNQTSTYSDYCSGVSVPSEAQYCPPSNNESAFDLCLAETIKPVFRYNFK